MNHKPIWGQGSGNSQSIFLSLKYAKAKENLIELTEPLLISGKYGGNAPIKDKCISLVQIPICSLTK